MAADLVAILETVAVTQLLTPTGKALGETILERGKQMTGKAIAYLAAVGRQPQTVEEKLLVPMALGAGLESDPILADLWAALLANAADPAQQNAVHTRYIEILRQLTPAEASLLVDLFAEAEAAHNAKKGLDKMLVKHPYRKQDAMNYNLDLDKAFRSRYPKRKFGKSALALGDRQEFNAMVENILSLGIISAVPELLHEADSLTSDSQLDRRQALFTSFGYDFLQAVTPPRS